MKTLPYVCGKTCLLFILVVPELNHVHLGLILFLLYKRIFDFKEKENTKSPFLKGRNPLCQLADPLLCKVLLEIFCNTMQGTVPCVDVVYIAGWARQKTKIT